MINFHYSSFSMGAEYEFMACVSVRYWYGDILFILRVWI